MYGSGSSLLAKVGQRMPGTLGGGGTGEGGVGLGWDVGGRYLTQVWENGDLCDKTTFRRKVEVQVMILFRFFFFF